MKSLSVADSRKNEDLLHIPLKKKEAYSIQGIGMSLLGDYTRGVCNLTRKKVKKPICINAIIAIHDTQKPPDIFRTCGQRVLGSCFHKNSYGLKHDIGRCKYN